MAPESMKWYVDSAASAHMTSHLDWMINIRKLQTPMRIYGSGNQCHIADTSGDVVVTEETTGHILTMKNVLYVPDLHFNLYSVPQAVADGTRVIFDQTTICTIESKDGKVVVDSVDGMWSLSLKPVDSTINIHHRALLSKVDQFYLWHLRFGHTSFNALRKTIEQNAVADVGHLSRAMMVNHDQFRCDVCIRSKTFRQAFKHQLPSDGPPTDPLQCIHMDLCDQLLPHLLVIHIF
jgi:hypothetical protein